MAANQGKPNRPAVGRVYHGGEIGAFAALGTLAGAWYGRGVEGATGGEIAAVAAIATALGTFGARLVRDFIDRRTGRLPSIGGLGLALLGLFVFVGCGTGLGPLSGMPYAAGESTQDIASCKGEAQVWYGEVEEDEDGILTPSGEGWLVQCRGGEAYWHMGDSHMDDLIEGVTAAAVKAAVEGASPVE